MNPTATIGTLLEADGTWSLRFERHLRHPIDKVWRTLVEPEHRDVWFPQKIVGELVPGGALEFTSDPNLDFSFSGRCLAVEPPRRLELEWGTDVLRIELTEDGDGTRLTFTDLLGSRDDAARTGSGWHHCLDVMVAMLDGDPRPQLTDADWDDLRQVYEDALFG